MGTMQPPGWACLLAVLASPAVLAADTLDQFEVKGVRNSLGVNQSEWWEHAGTYRRQAPTGDALELGVRRVDYFEHVDYEGAGEMTFSPGNGRRYRLKATYSPDHLVLPAWTGQAEWDRRFDSGFGLRLGRF